MSTRLVTFGGGASRYRRAAHRVAREARKSGLFDRADAMTERQLRRDHPDFVKQHAAMLAPDVRGFGYWIWKPYLIDASLQDPDVEFLAYLDAGGVLNLGGATARRRFREYHDLAAERGFFVMQSGFEEQAWCKADTMDRIGLAASGRATGQIETGFLLIKNSPATRDLVRQWLDLSGEAGYRYLDDSPSEAPNAPSFNEHRHDQAIFSCLCKVAGISTTPNESDFPTGWATLGADFPIWSARHRWGTRFDPTGSDSLAHRVEERIDDLEGRLAARRSWHADPALGVDRGVFLDQWASPRVIRYLAPTGSALQVRGRLPGEYPELIGQRLSLWCDGELLADQQLSPGPFTWKLALPLRPRGERVQVKLHASRSFVPKRVGLNGDIRRLSYYLDEVTVTDTDGTQ